MSDTSAKRYHAKSAGILLLLLAAACVFIFHTYLFGNETLVFSDIGSDTKEQYIMWYNGIANSIRSGSFSLWDFRNGLGVNQYNLNLTGPFLIWVYLFGALFGPSKIAKIMVFVQIAKVLLAGLFAYLMLSQYRFREEAKIIGAFLYGLNGYLMIWGQHYQMGTVVVLLPLLVMFMEMACRKKTALFGVAAMSGIIILNGYYQGYMVMLGLAMFAFLRILLYDRRTFGARLRLFILEGLSMVFGVLIGALNLLPSVMDVAGSARLDSNQPLLAKILDNLSLWGKEYYRTLLYRLFGNHLQGSGNAFLGTGNYYEAINLFFSVLFVLLLFQYLFLIPRQKASVLQKITQYLGVLLGVFLVTVRLGSLIFNGFTYAFSRHSFLLMPFFALVVGWTLTWILETGKVSMIALAAGTIVSAMVYVKAYQNYQETRYETNALILLVCMFVMAWSLASLGRLGRKMHRPAYPAAEAGGSPNVYDVAVSDQAAEGPAEKNRKDRNRKGSGKRTAARYVNENLLQKQTDRQAMLVRVLAAAVFISVVADASLGYQERETVKKTDDEYFRETYEGDTIEALAWIREQDDGFYRIEKDYSDAGYYLESLAQNYYPVSTYNSTQNSYILQFVQNLWPQLSNGSDINHHSFRSSTHEAAMASLVGVRYLLTHRNDLQVDGYELLHQTGTVYIYKNTNTWGPASFYTKTMTEKAYRRSQENLDTWDLLGDVLITKGLTKFDASKQAARDYRKEVLQDVLDLDRIDAPHYQVLEDGQALDGIASAVLPLKAESLSGYEHVSVQFTVQTDESASLLIYMGDERATEYYSRGEHNFTLDLPEGVDEIHFETEDPADVFRIRAITFYGSHSKRDFVDHAKITLQAPERDSLVTGTVEAEQDGVLMLAIPYQDGWSVYLDGEKQPLIRGDFGFLSIEVPEGTHELKAEFEAPMFKASLLITIAAAGLWLIGLLTTLFVGKARARSKETEKR